MIEAASISETLVNFYQIARRNNPEDSHLQTRRRENLKSHFVLLQFTLHGKDSFSLNKTSEPLYLLEARGTSHWVVNSSSRTSGHVNPGLCGGHGSPYLLFLIRAASLTDDTRGCRYCL
jgi:hypothetical protein